jgi:hypothetical protein
MDEVQLGTEVTPEGSGHAKLLVTEDGAHSRTCWLLLFA